MSTKRKPYPSDVSDDEWSFVAPYLTLMRLDASQRDHDLRAVFNALRWIVRAGTEWRMLPHDFPPWEAVFQQSQRWLKSGAFTAIVHGSPLGSMRIILRLAAGRAAQPTATIFDSRTLQSSAESGGRAGYDGAKRKRGSKVGCPLGSIAVDTLGGCPLGSMLALHVTPANAQDRTQVATLAAVQAEAGVTVTLAYVDQGYIGDRPAADAEAHGITLEVVKLPDAKHGFVLLPRRWVVERSFAWMSRFRRLVRDDERLPETLVGLHLVAVTSLMLSQAFPPTDSSSQALGLEQALDYVREGDVLVVWRLDRLGRSLKYLIEIITTLREYSTLCGSVSRPENTGRGARETRPCLSRRFPR